MPHFEIHAADTAAARAFYGGLFGWDFAPMVGLEAIDYQVIEGPGIGGSSGLTAAILRRPDQPHPASSAVRGGVMTFEVDDCDRSYAWALANGGAEALAPETLPEVGRFAYVEDGQGNIVGMIEQQGEEAN